MRFKKVSFMVRTYVCTYAFGFGERFGNRIVRTLKASCWDRLILYGENSIRRSSNEFVEFYHHEHNHEGLGNRIIDPQFDVGSTNRSVACRDRPGGLLRHRNRNAAWFSQATAQTVRMLDPDRCQRKHE
jgi:hypothetical protein